MQKLKDAAIKKGEFNINGKIYKAICTPVSQDSENKKETSDISTQLETAEGETKLKKMNSSDEAELKRVNKAFEVRDCLIKRKIVGKIPRRRKLIK